MPSYARWPPASPVRPGSTPVAVRRDAPVAVGRGEPGGFPPARAPGVRSPRRAVGAHRTRHVDRSRQPGRVDARRVHAPPPCTRSDRHADPLPAGLAGPAGARSSGGVRGLRPRPGGPAHPHRPAKLRRRRPGWDRAASSRLRRVLVDELRQAPEQPLQLPEPRDDRLRAIAQLLYDQPADNSSLAELGRAAGASARTLSRLLHDELGLTFYEWRTQLRVYHALVLLADGHDATRVAYACGWANPSSFIAAFTALVGTTPGRYRASGQWETAGQTT